MGEDAAPAGLYDSTHEATTAASSGFEGFFDEHRGRLFGILCLMTGNNVGSSPAVANGVVYVGSSGNSDASQVDVKPIRLSRDKRPRQCDNISPVETNDPRTNLGSEHVGSVGRGLSPRQIPSSPHTIDRDRRADEPHVSRFRGRLSQIAQPFPMFVVMYLTAVRRPSIGRLARVSWPARRGQSKPLMP